MRSGREECGAFFGSIHATLSHILWADQTWMHRLAGTPAPAASNIATSKDMVADWVELCAQRQAFDPVIADWAVTVTPEWLAGDLTWRSGATGRDISKPRWVLITHLFNHQTHHRGQVHCMLTQAGARPDDTDIPFMPDAP